MNFTSLDMVRLMITSLLSSLRCIVDVTYILNQVSFMLVPQILDELQTSVKPNIECLWGWLGYVHSHFHKHEKLQFITKMWFYHILECSKGYVCSVNTLMEEWFLIMRKIENDLELHELESVSEHIRRSHRNKYVSLPL